MKKILSIIVSLSILVVIYSKINLSELANVLKNASLTWFFICLSLWVPIILLLAWRYYIITPKEANLTYKESLHLVFLACSLNIVLPSKMGDLAKSFFLWQQKNISKSLALSIGILEKTFDLLMVFLLAIIGLFFYFPGNHPMYLYSLLFFLIIFICALIMGFSSTFAKIVFYLPIKLTPSFISKKINSFKLSWLSMQIFIFKNINNFISTFAISVVNSFIFFLQMWFIFFILNTKLPLLTSMAILPMGIMAGWLPFTLAGIGTRDAALIGLLASQIGPAQATAFGLMCTIRLIVPAIFGLPFLSHSLNTKSYQAPPEHVS